MKIVVDRVEMLRAWQVCMRYTPKKTTLDALNGIRVRASDEGIQLEATNLKSAVKYLVSGKVIEGGEAVLNAAIFGDMLKKAEVGGFELSTTGNRGVLTTAMSKLRLALIPAGRFPKLPEDRYAEGVCDLDVEDFIRVVQEGSSAASQPSEFPKYMGMCLLRTSGGMLTVVSTDGRRLARSEVSCDVERDVELVLPALELRELANNMSGPGRVKVKSYGSMVWFVVEEAEYSQVLTDATFPKYEKVLKEDVVSQLRVSKGDLVSAVERIAVIARNTPDRIMALSLGDGLMLSARAPGLGTVREVVGGARVDGAELTLGFNVNFFLSGVKAMRADEVLIEFSGPNEQVRMYNADTKDFLYMLMPMSLSASDMSDDIGDDEEVEAEVKSDDEGGMSNDDWTSGI